MPSTRISNRAPGRIVIAPILFGLLGHVYDEREFLSRYGICSLSKLHEAQPFEWGGHRATYEPAESAEKHKGGNSNWRGPIHLIPRGGRTAAAAKLICAEQAAMVCSIASLSKAPLRALRLP